MGRIRSALQETGRSIADWIDNSELGLGGKNDNRWSSGLASPPACNNFRPRVHWRWPFVLGAHWSFFHLNDPMASWMTFPIRVLILAALLPTSAWAYIDPGTGLVLWQGVIALIGALLLFIRHPLASLKRLMHYLIGIFKR